MGQASPGWSMGLGIWEGHWKQVFGGERVEPKALAPALPQHLGPNYPRPGCGHSKGAGWHYVWPHADSVCILAPLPREATSILVSQFPPTSQGCGGLKAVGGSSSLYRVGGQRTLALLGRMCASIPSQRHDSALGRGDYRVRPTLLDEGTSHLPRTGPESCPLLAVMVALPSFPPQSQH